MSVKHNYIDGEWVLYEMAPGIKGTAIVKGVCDSGNPVIGIKYMLEDPSQFPSAAYPYSCFPCFECFMKPLVELKKGTENDETNKA